MIYVDNAATTKVYKAAIEKMLPFLEFNYGNPSSSHAQGRNAFEALKSAREKIALLLGADEKEIIFTSGGTEANNLAVFIGKSTGKQRFIVSEIEHDSVYNPIKALEQEGYEVITLPVDKNGVVSPDDVKRHINENTALVSVMAANNEIGTIQPIAEIGRICRENNCYFHTDGVQFVGHEIIIPKETSVDIMSISAHKFGGVKGVGALYVRNNIHTKGLIIGGGQENGIRAGTEALPLIVAMAEALEESLKDLKEKQKKVSELRNLLERELLSIPYSCVNGGGAERLCGHLNVSFKGINSDALLMMLDEAGICAAKGSACHAGSETPSRVLTALGLDTEYALGSVRFSLSAENTKEEIYYIAKKTKEIIKKLRDN